MSPDASPDASPADGSTASQHRLRRLVMFPLSFVLVGLAWEAYKLVGPEAGGRLLGVRVLPRTGDRAMPHIYDMLRRLGQPEVRGGPRSVLVAVVHATWYSLRVACLAFVVGSALGIGLAVLMARFRMIERALMPYVVVSQTVPIIVMGPLIVSIMAYNSRDLAGETWLAAAVLGVSLAFFPVALGTLRGLQSVAPSSLELMDSLASGWWRTLFKLRFPSAVPFMAPALRLAGAAAVVGVIVAEISLGIRFGVGRLILSYGQEASSDPPKLYAAVFGAAVLGLIMAAMVVGIDHMLMRNRPKELT